MRKTRIADLFCGGGGETTGIVQAAAAAGLRLDLAAVNHWQVAIETHRLNHPDARAYCHDLASLNPLDVFGARDRVDLLWASPECTHHSVARGGRPRSEQGRASAWLILKWLSELYVRRVILENVPEFMSWGPLGADGQPLRSGKGKLFHAFVEGLRSLGYTVDWQILCAANYGDPTTRRRFFLQAVRGGARILWPEPSHAERPGLMSERPWVSAREVIDWNIRGESIFTRKRPLAPATLRRIEAGINRYWGEWADPFLVVLRGTGRVRETGRPLPAITANGQHLGLVQPFLLPYHGEDRRSRNRSHSLDTPLPTVLTSNSFGVVEPFLFTTTHGGRTRGLDRPMPTVTGAHRGETGLVQPFLIKYYGTADAQAVMIPLGALTTRDRYALIQGQPQGLDITFRMLQPHELAAAQGFPDGYRFAGNKGDQVRQIGNAVPVNTARALALEALAG